MTARLGSGSLEGEAHSQQVYALAGSNAVRLEGLKGSVDVKSGSGDVTLQWARVPQTGNVNVKTGNGDVALIFPEGAKIKTRILSGSGRIHNEIGDARNAELNVSIISGSGKVSIGTLVQQASTAGLLETKLGKPYLLF